MYGPESGLNQILKLIRTYGLFKKKINLKGQASEMISDFRIFPGLITILRENISQFSPFQEKYPYSDPNFSHLNSAEAN